MDDGADARLAYSRALDKADSNAWPAETITESAGEAVVDWLETVACADMNACSAAQKACCDSVDFAELVNWMESWGPTDSDRTLVAT